MSERTAFYRFCALAFGGYAVLAPWIAWSWWIWGGFVLLFLPVLARAVLDREEHRKAPLSYRDQEDGRDSAGLGPIPPAESGGAVTSAPTTSEAR